MATTAKKINKPNSKNLWQPSHYSWWQLLLVVVVVAAIGIILVLVTHASAPPLSVKDSRFGAVGDGVHDDTVAIQSAIDAASAAGTPAYPQELRLPPGTYKVTGPLFMKSFVYFRGTPGQTILEHSQNPAEPKLNQIMFIGNVQPSAFDARKPATEQFTNFAVNGEYKKDSNSLMLADTSSASQFQVNEFVCIRSKKVFNNDGWAQPDFVQFNKISNISGGKLEFAQTALNTITDPQVCKITGQDPYMSALLGKPVNWHTIRRIEVSGITFQNAPYALVGGGCYNCVVKNNIFKWISRPMALNTIVNSTFSDLTGTYDGANNALEIKMASNRSTFKNINLTYDVESQNKQNPAHVMDIGERSEDITVDAMTLNIPPQSTTTVRPLAIGDAKNVKFINSNIIYNGGERGGAVLEMRGNIDAQQGSTFSTENYLIKNNTFHVGLPQAALVVMAGYSNSPLKDLRFSNNTWTGASTISGTAYQAIQSINNWIVENDKITISTHMGTSGNSQQPVLKNVLFANNQKVSSH